MDSRLRQAAGSLEGAAKGTGRWALATKPLPATKLHPSHDIRCQTVLVLFTTRDVSTWNASAVEFNQAQIVMCTRSILYTIVYCSV